MRELCELYLFELTSCQKHFWNENLVEQKAKSDTGSVSMRMMCDTAIYI